MAIRPELVLRASDLTKPLERLALYVNFDPHL